MSRVTPDAGQVRHLLPAVPHRAALPGGGILHHGSVYLPGSKIFKRNEKYSLQVQELERANELQTKRDMRDQRLAMTDTLWEITRGMEVPHRYLD